MNSGRKLWEERLISVARLVIGFLFFCHGMQKMFAFPPPPHPEPMAMYSLPWFSGVLELVCGAFILVGLLTRFMAFIASGEMAVAYFMMHAPKGFWPIANGGEPAVAYCFIFLALVATGGGAWSLDWWLAHRHRDDLEVSRVGNYPAAPQT